MKSHKYLWPFVRTAVLGAAVATLGAAGTAWAHDSDDESDRDSKDVKVFVWEGKDDEDGGGKVYELKGEDGDTREFHFKRGDGDDKEFRFKVEGADSKGGYLGVQVQNVTRALMRARNLPSDEGALVNRVENDGPADDAGLRRGDVIVRVDRTDIGDAGDLIRTMRDLEPGKKVDVVVVREGTRRTLSVTLGKRPPEAMVVGPGNRWRGEMPDMTELRKHLKEIDPEQFRTYMRHNRADESELHSQMEDLQKELSELRDELRELRLQLRDSQGGRSGSRSGS
jgi:hypothetical protein